MLDLIRCSVKTKACSNTTLGAFLCEEKQGQQLACSPRASPRCRLQSKQSLMPCRFSTRWVQCCPCPLPLSGMVFVCVWSPGWGESGPICLLCSMTYHNPLAVTAVVRIGQLPPMDCLIGCMD